MKFSVNTKRRPFCRHKRIWGIYCYLWRTTDSRGRPVKIAIPLYREPHRIWGYKPNER